MEEPPFERIYVVTVEKKASRVYTSLSQAKAQITRTTDFGKHRVSALTMFSADCALWAVGPSGWELLFSGKAGESAHRIPWRGDETCPADEVWQLHLPLEDTV